MKLGALMVLFCVACLLTGSSQEDFAPQDRADFRNYIAQLLRKRAIEDLKNSQHIALCEHRKGLGHVISKVIRGRVSGDFVGQLQVGQLWNNSGFPMGRILAFERFEIGDIGASTGSISSAGYFSIDCEERIVISDEHAVYLSVEELIRILEESKKSTNKPTRTGGGMFLK